MDHQPSIKQALDYMERHLQDDIRVETVAHAVGFSPSQFYAVFARTTGRTPADHLRRRRLACAALDLALSRRRILDIALAYRFESQEAFSRAFKRVYGVTPGLFRRHRSAAKVEPLLGIYHPHEVRAAKGGFTMSHEPSPEPSQPASRLVLQEVMKVGFETVPPRCPENIPFPSSLAACLRYLGEDYPWIPLEAHGQTWQLNYANVHILAASGMAFGLLWRDGWHPDNVDVMFVADPREIIHRAFAAIGYSYEVVEKTGDPQDDARYRQKLKASLRAGCPALAFGVIGPPECCIITGYDEDGDVLIGWNYFQSDPAFREGLEFEPNGMFRIRNWFPHTHSVVLIGEKGAQPVMDVRETLRWGLQVARTPEVFGRHAGFAAYDAWAAHILSDSAFPADDPVVLHQRHEVHLTESGTLAECRAWAGQFLSQVARQEPAMAEHLRAAADCYNTEHDLVWQMWGLSGGPGDPHAATRFASPEVRRQTAEIIWQMKALDEQAADHLEKACLT